MKNTGIVINVDGEFVEIISMRESACSGSCESCSAHCESKPETVKTINTIKAKPGDRVEMEVNTLSVLSYIGLMYGMPLIVFLISVIISFSLLGKDNQLFCFLIGLVSLAVTYLIIKKLNFNANSLNYEIKLRKIA